MNFSICRTVIIVPVLAMLCSCSSMKLPDMDFIKFPEFKEDAQNIPDYPHVADAPEKPKNLRSDAQWDQAAEIIIEKRDGFIDPALDDPKSDADILRAMQSLEDEADAYKKDDPQ